jgi:hypothetical protein
MTMAMTKLAWLALLPLALATAACDGTFKYFNFKVWDGGKEVYVEKFYNDGLGSVPHQKTAFDLASHGDGDAAIRVLEDHIAHGGGTDWDNYDLAILYERRHNWDKAEAAIREAIRLDRGTKTNNTDFTRELALIQHYREEEAKVKGK